jgi:nicotinamide-nucleotide amidase
MPGDDSLYQLAADCGRLLVQRHWRVALAESCTGGWISKALTDVPGSSRWFECGYVSYSNSAKQRMLGVSGDALLTHGAVSREVVLQMAQGARLSSGADLALSVSGIAGPDGGSDLKPVGLVWFGIASVSGTPVAEGRQLTGDREAVRRQAVQHALSMILRAAAD